MFHATVSDGQRHFKASPGWLINAPRRCVWTQSAREGAVIVKHQPDEELAQVLLHEWIIQPDEVLDVLVARTDSPRLRLLRSILSGPIDIDKMDCLERDSLHCGAPYGRHFDKSRLIQSLIVNESGDGLAITQKGRTAAELMVFALLARRPNTFLLDVSQRLIAELNRTGAVGSIIEPLDLLIDAPPPHREVEFKVPIYFPKEDRYRQLSEVSPVVESLARKQFDDYVKRVRLFARPDLAPRLAACSGLEAAIHRAARF